MHIIALLQFLLVLSAKDAISQTLLFPGLVADEKPGQTPVLANRYQPIAPSLKTTERPACSVQAGEDDPNAPCEADDDYDISVREHIQRILRETGLNSVVGDAVFKDIMNDVHPRTGSSIGGRIGGNSTEAETPICQAEETLIFPKRARSASNEWVFVLNQDNVEQAIKVEKCISEGSACNFGTSSPIETRTVCRQKYVYRRLLTVDSNTIQPEEVLMPSCCVCYKE